jgi:hypothetical protein
MTIAKGQQIAAPRRHVVRLTPFRFGGPQAGETAKTCSTALETVGCRLHRLSAEKEECLGIPPADYFNIALLDNVYSSLHE